MSQESKRKSLIGERMKLLKMQNPNVEGLQLYYLLVKDFLNGGIKLAYGKYVLRGAEVGKYVSVFKKMKFVNNGKVKIGDHTKIWSKIDQTKIFVKKGLLLALESIHLLMVSLFRLRRR